MKIAFSGISIARPGALAVLCLSGRTLSATALKVDKKTGGALTRALDAGRFKGEKGQIVDILAPSGVKASRILIVGVGDAAKASTVVLQNVGGAIAAHLATSGEKAVSVAVDGIKGGGLAAPEMAAQIAYGALLGSYRFDKYHTKQEAAKKPSLGRLTVMIKDAPQGRRAFAGLEKVARGVFMTRDLVSEPGNVIYPETFAAQARGLGDLGIKVEVLGEARLKSLGMGALLGVGLGSARESRVVVMRWNGAPKSSKLAPVAFIGKGVTFDSGGISLKPGAGMAEMKWDMGGAGAVTGLMRALAGRKARVDAVGVIGLVENMPSGDAQRPGDVVKSMSGQTIEILNTDAEGRLVLADILWYAHKRFKPVAMIDLATLTGAIIVTLGHLNAGMFANDDALADALHKAGETVGEGLWRLPLDKSYDKMIDSPIADMQNIGAGRDAGSIVAAQFLQRFVGDTPWAHLDIAGMAWSKKSAPTVPKGGTGFGVRLLDQYVRDVYEAK